MLVPAGRRPVVGAVAALLVLSGCGVQDRLTEATEVTRLRDEVRQIVASAQSKAESRVDVSPDVLLGALVSEIPPEPTGYRLGAIVLPDTDQAQVSFALDGKIDGIGPGQETVVLRICVRVTMTPPPTLGSTIEDADCSSLPTTATIVAYAE